MLSVEKALKNCKFRPLKVAGEIVFGSQGELWEQKRLEVNE